MTKMLAKSYIFQTEEIKEGQFEDATESESVVKDTDHSEEDEFSDFDYGAEWGDSRGPNKQRVDSLNRVAHKTEEYYKKFAARIKVDDYKELSGWAGNKIQEAVKKEDHSRIRRKDKQDRATVEQVMDPRTRMILYKLLSNGKLASIDGCISTGKEANVYHATGNDGKSLALKIYKTSILTFKSRDKYVTGEFRWRQGYSKRNPRKMIRLWAEKEFRNLMRISSSGIIKVPTPILLKNNVLLMEFIGEKGWPCPLLKDVKIDCGSKTWERLYRDCLMIIFKLYKACKLVHADFSEFNLILKDEEIWVIDVSQSVEHDHPRSFDFLKSDLHNVQDFFGKKGVALAEFKKLFEFVTSPDSNIKNYEAILDNLLDEANTYYSRTGVDVDTEVFKKSFIPQKMTQVEHYERDSEVAKKNEDDAIYAHVLGLKNLNTEPSPSSSNSDSESEADHSDSNSMDNCAEESKFKPSRRPKDETQEEKKERKKLVKAEKAEKRQTKVKKHVKKRQEKLAHHNSKRK